MKNTLVMSVLLCGGLLVLGGCGTGGVLDPFAALDDANDNGYLDLVPPTGVDFDEETNINVRIANEISAEEAAAMIAEMGVPGAAAGLLSVEITLTLDYGDADDVTVVTFTEDLAPFERQFEAACPDSVIAEVTVVANIPLIGTQEVFTQAIQVYEGAEYECGQTVSVEATMENGMPTVDTDIS